MWITLINITNEWPDPLPSICLPSTRCLLMGRSVIYTVPMTSLICTGNSPSLWELYLPTVVSLDPLIWWDPNSTHHQDKVYEAAISKVHRMKRLHCHPLKHSNPILSIKGNRKLVLFAILSAVVPLCEAAPAIPTAPQIEVCCWQALLLQLQAQEEQASHRGALPADQPGNQGAGIRTFGNKLSLGAILLMKDDQRATGHDREIGNSPKWGDAFMLNTLVLALS